MSPWFKPIKKPTTVFNVQLLQSNREAVPVFGGAWWGLISDSWEDIYLPVPLAPHTFPVGVHILNSWGPNGLLSQMCSATVIITQQGSLNDTTKLKFCSQSFNSSTLGLGGDWIHVLGEKLPQVIIFCRTTAGPRPRCCWCRGSCYIWLEDKCDKMDNR